MHLPAYSARLISAISEAEETTAEEAAVLIFDSEDHAKAAAETLSGYVQDQIDQNRDYRPAEVPKLENKWLEQRGNTVLLVVANDLKAAQDAVK